MSTTAEVLPVRRRAFIAADLRAGTVVFLVAMPLCLGVAQASGAPLLSGILAGILGGLLTGLLSGSHTSVSGPAAGLTAIVAAQIVTLGSFENFLLAVVLAGVFQVGFGILRAGGMAAFVPSAVIDGLLAAIGLILILKQIPHVFGHDTDPEGEMSFQQIDHENTFSELMQTLAHIHPGATLIGVSSIAILWAWSSVPQLARLKLPASFVVVIFGLISVFAFRQAGGRWLLGGEHLVRLPEANGLMDFFSNLQTPNWKEWLNPAIYTSAVTIAIVASLETLLNLEAVDKLDPKHRQSPANRELVAQGIGNTLCGMIGGLPMTSVIVRSSVNIHSGCQTRLSTVFHGFLLLISVLFLARWLNYIPISCLAAILFMTGLKLASPKLCVKMWKAGRSQFLPFIVTVLAILFTDLLTGVLIGLAVSVGFILHSNLKRPVRQLVEKHLGGEVLRLQLSEHVSFLSRPGLEQTLRDAKQGTHILLDAHDTSYIDPDVLRLIHDYRDRIAPQNGIEVSLTGFRDHYELHEDIRYVDYSTRQLQTQLTAGMVLHILMDGNRRFRTGKRLIRDLARQKSETAAGQFPLAVVLSCIDSRTPAELVFDLGLGDIFSVRIAGNVISDRVLGSIEYSCGVAGAKLVVVMGHSRCGAVTAAVKFANSKVSAEQATGCQHLESILRDIQQHADCNGFRHFEQLDTQQQEALVDSVARENVSHVVNQILQQSTTIARLTREGQIALVGMYYNVTTGEISFVDSALHGISASEMETATDPTNNSLG
jgi:MFS superfamily sulfate permease-like transporter